MKIKLFFRILAALNIGTGAMLMVTGFWLNHWQPVAAGGCFVLFGLFACPALCKFWCDIYEQ